ncbi:MAG: hypothetical protein RLZZ436_1257 [Planctomycetota bacterium]
MCWECVCRGRCPRAGSCLSTLLTVLYSQLSTLYSLALASRLRALYPRASALRLSAFGNAFAEILSGRAEAPGCVSHPGAGAWLWRWHRVSGALYPRASALRLMCFWQCVCRDFEWAGGSPRLRFAPWCGRLAAVLASRFGGVYPRASALRLMCGCGTPFGCRTLPESQALLGIRLSRACGQGGHTGNTDFPVVPIRSRMPPPSGILLLPFRVIPACS